MENKEWDNAQVRKGDDSHERIIPFKMILAVVIGILIFVFWALVFIPGTGFDDKISLESELNNLTVQLSENGYDWLVEYNLKNGGNI